MCTCSSEEGCEPQGTLELVHTGMHMRTHTLGNESHGNSSVGGGDNPMKGEAAKEWILNDTGLGDISEYLLLVRCLLEVAGPSWRLSQIHCLGLDESGLVRGAVGQVSTGYGQGWGQGPSEEQPLLEEPEGSEEGLL